MTIVVLEKKKKSKGAFRPDKKEKSNFSDTHSPAASKIKNVHGVVGPAEYIQDQTNPSAEESVSTIPQDVPAPTPASSNQMFLQKTPQKVQNQQPLQQPLAQSQHAPVQVPQWNANAQIQPPPQQQQQQHPKLQHHSSSPNFQQGVFPNQNSGQFSTSYSQSTKVERPHSSAALLQERPTPQSPTPFKQPSATNTPQKMTLLAQAMTSGQIQVKVL